MEYKIEKRKAFKIAGIIHKGCKLDTNFTEFWDQLYQTISFDKLKLLGNATAYGCCYSEDNDQTFSYVPSYHLTNEKLAKKYGLDVLEIPETEYAIIALKGKVPYCILEGWEFVEKELFNNEDMKNYQISNSPYLEVYSKGDMYSNFYEMELWVSIEKK